HLHYELRKNGEALNASRVQLPGKPGVPDARMADFRALVADRIALLDAHLPAGPHLAETAGETERTLGGDSWSGADPSAHTGVQDEACRPAAGRLRSQDGSGGWIC